MHCVPWQDLLSQFPTAPYPHLLGPYVIPTADERRVIKMVINVAEECLALLDQKILYADHVPKEISAERRRRSLFIKEHKQMLNIVRYLTFDVTLEIFKACVQLDIDRRPEDDAGHLLTPGYMECPLLLTHICSEWRDIALSSPTLWSSISYKNRANSLGSKKSRIIETRGDRIKAWVERSKQCALFVRIDWGWDTSLEHHQYDIGRVVPGNVNVTDDPLNDDGLKLLISQSHRWVTADVSGPINVFRGTMESMTGYGELRRLRVLSPVRMGLPNDEIQAFGPPGLMLTDVDSVLPMGQLTHLSVVVTLRLKTHWYRALLNVVPMLENLHLNIRLDPSLASDSTAPAPLQRVLHSRLQTLTVESETLSSSDHLDLLLDNITLPRLIKLSLAVYSWGKSGTISSFFTHHPSLEFIDLRRSCTPLEMKEHGMLKEDWPFVSLSRVGLGPDNNYHYRSSLAGESLDLHDYYMTRRRKFGPNWRKYEDVNVEKVEMKGQEIRRILLPHLRLALEESDGVTLPPGENWVVSEGVCHLKVVPLSSD
ncbi:hypothetical protein VKT23_017048 [Stygiomarasmius scandens]|uniref:F-box domain-containing protein n=1 Tax=Marasmiellus scandens TaxID=2682957 RepID=A0ABR1IW18_9AGAR